MATNKKSSTSKTARVMNLLSKNREEVVDPEIAAEPHEVPSPAPAAKTAEPASPESAAPAVPAPAPAPVHHPSTPPLISSMQADSAISDQVFSALENALDDELRDAQAVEAPAAAPAEINEPEITPNAAPEAESVNEAVTEPVTETFNEEIHDAVSDAIAQITEAEEAVVEAAESSVIPVPAAAAPDSGTQPHPPTRFPVDKSTIYVNVMESLVEDKAMKYIDLFGLCKCHRCVADVKALALNRLEPKYVVMHTGEVIPRITLYEGQFSAAVTAQLLTACKLVMEHPRHDR